eukprot:2967794-Heterocapsa_arctica.AAC.1
MLEKEVRNGIVKQNEHYVYDARHDKQEMDEEPALRVQLAHVELRQHQGRAQQPQPLPPADGLPGQVSVSGGSAASAGTSAENLRSSLSADVDAKEVSAETFGGYPRRLRADDEKVDEQGGARAAAPRAGRKASPRVRSRE